MFRQLLEFPLVTDDGILQGQPWGIVNYHPDKCAAWQEHWHVVWQQGEDLRRSSVVVAPVFETFCPDEGDHFIASCVHDLITTGTTPYFAGKPPLEGLLSYGGEGIRIDTRKGFRATLALSDAGRAAVNAWTQLQSHRASAEKHAGEELPDWKKGDLQQAEQRLTEALMPFTAEVSSYEATTDKLYERYTAAVNAERERRDRHAQVRVDLAALPQLFIAV
ncbi:MAG: hypothetical protein ACT4NY_14315 [Pseudonocardiales bacterium]